MAKSREAKWKLKQIKKNGDHKMSILHVKLLFIRWHNG